MTWLFRLSLLGAVGCLMAIAVTQLLPQAGHVLEFTSTELDIGEVVVGKNGDAVFHVKNTSRHARRLLNVVPSCTLNCCYNSKIEQQVPVPGYAEIDYVVEVKANKPGPFEVQTELFVDDNGLRAIPITIRGIGVAAKP